MNFEANIFLVACVLFNASFLFDLWLQFTNQSKSNEQRVEQRVAYFTLNPDFDLYKRALITPFEGA